MLYVAEIRRRPTRPCFLQEAPKFLTELLLYACLAEESYDACVVAQHIFSGDPSSTARAGKAIATSVKSRLTKGPESWIREEFEEEQGLDLLSNDKEESESVSALMNNALLQETIRCFSSRYSTNSFKAFLSKAGDNSITPAAAFMVFLNTRSSIAAGYEHLLEFELTERNLLADYFSSAKELSYRQRIGVWGMLRGLSSAKFMRDISKDALVENEYISRQRSYAESVNLNYRNESGLTLLGTLLEREWLDTASNRQFLHLLLAVGVPLNARDESGLTSFYPILYQFPL